MGNPVLSALYEQRKAQEQFVETLYAGLKNEETGENRDLSDSERQNLEAARRRIDEIDAQITPIEEFEKVRVAHVSELPQAPRPAGSGASNGPAERGLGYTEPRSQYRTAGEFLSDYCRAYGPMQDREALARIEAENSRALPSITTGESTGVLPETIQGAINTDIDGARPLIQTFGAKPLTGIPGTKFTRPIVTQHTSSEQQTAELAQVTSNKFVIGQVEFTKSTYGGALDVSRQDIDWTSPSAWQALISDLVATYSSDTDDRTAVHFEAGVTQTVPLESKDVVGYVKALYKAAVAAVTAAGTKKARTLRLPDHIWVSIDQWAEIGSAIDAVRATGNTAINPGNTSPTAFGGDILSVPRTMVPGLPEGTIIVGRSSLFEFYEERIGLISAVKPSVFGVEIAHGGYAADGFIDPTAFVKIDPDTVP